MANLAVFNKTIQDPRTQDYLNDVLKERKDTFVASLVSVVANNQNLQACEPITLMYAAMKATALNLPFDPNLGFAYVIPYQNKGKTEAQFQMGYKGFIQLAMRSGQFASINADKVYEGEISKTDKLSGDIELNGEKKSDKVVGYFAYFRLINGFSKTVYMTVDEVRKHANRFSQTAKRGYGLWADKDSFDAMARKTVLKMLLSKYAPLSIDMQSAITADQAVFHENDKAEYVDNQEQPDEQRNEAVEKVRAKAEAVRARAKKATAKPEEKQEEPAEEDEDENTEEPIDLDAETGEMFSEENEQ